MTSHQLTILYCGNALPGWTGDSRINALRRHGYSVLTADSSPMLRLGTRIERSLAFRFHIGRGVRAFNRLLQEEATKLNFDIVFVDKGVWVWPETLAALKRAAKTRLAIHYTPDSQFLENRSRFFLHGLRYYDLAVTTKSFELNTYRLSGARDVLLIHQGYSDDLFPLAPAQISSKLRSDVVFIGHCQPAYARVLKIIAGRVPLAIWGPGWMAYARRHRWALGVVRGDGLYGPDYVRALSGAKIAIGLLSKRIPETTTTRTFEIPACGTMLLAERTADHAELFEEGHEAEFFDSAEEAADKAAFYLANDQARKMIALTGFERCRRSGYSVKNQFNRVVGWIMEHAGTVDQPGGNRI